MKTKPDSTKYVTIEGNEVILSKQTLTHWGRPNEIMLSGYGKITYRGWCERELKRINQRGDGVRIITRMEKGKPYDGYIALYRPSGSTVKGE